MPNYDASDSVWSPYGSVPLYRCQVVPQRGKNDFKMASNKWFCKSVLNMCKFPGHNTNTKWNKQLEQFWIYIDIDHDVGCEQSWWMKGICLMWSRCRHYSGADTGWGADWYLTLSSQYKRSAGRNLGDTRHGTAL